FTRVICTGAGRSGAGLVGGGGRQADTGRRRAASRGGCAPEVGRGHRTGEVGEDAGNARRVDGGKGRGRGEIHRTKRVAGTGRQGRAHVPAVDRETSEGEAEGAVHQPAQPREGAAAEGGVSAPPQGRGDGNR